MTDRIEKRIQTLTEELQKAQQAAVSRDATCIAISNRIGELQELLREEEKEGE